MAYQKLPKWVGFREPKLVSYQWDLCGSMCVNLCVCVFVGHMPVRILNSSQHLPGAFGGLQTASEGGD